MEKVIFLQVPSVTIPSVLPEVCDRLDQPIYYHNWHLAISKLKKCTTHWQENGSGQKNKDGQASLWQGQ